MAVLVLISFLFISSILYMIYSVKGATVYNEEFDKEAFSKPPGWKVGKLPDDLKIQKEMEVRRDHSHNTTCVLEGLIQTLKVKNLSEDTKTDF